MSNPQQPALCRSDKGGATPQDGSQPRKAAHRGTKAPKKASPHGTDRGNKGGGESGGTPAEQQPDHH